MRNAEKLVTELNITSFDRLIRLTKKDIMSVHGFGEKSAENILKWLRE